MFGLSVHGLSGSSAATKEVEELAKAVLTKLGISTAKKPAKTKPVDKQKEAA
ncbi:hypothetical protein D3C86_2177420 [compost metagenome]